MGKHEQEHVNCLECINLVSGATNCIDEGYSYYPYFKCKLGKNLVYPMPKSKTLGEAFANRAAIKTVSPASQTCADFKKLT
jgi:hypothetical protein